ncbi:hypothetical protein D3C76_1363890 [compost metagenome]
MAFFSPKGRTEIAVKNNFSSPTLDGFGQVYHMAPDSVVHSQRDATEMYRINRLGNTFKIVSTLRRRIEAAFQPVSIRYPAWARPEAVLQKIQSQVVSTAKNELPFNAELPQIRRSRVA